MKLKAISTTYIKENTQTIVKEYDFIKDEKEIEMELINVYPEVEYQKFSGFGGAFTEASAYTLSRMSDAVYSQVIDEYFGEDGLNYSYCRTHIDSCDFSLGNYSAVDDAHDIELKTFSLERDEKYIIPMIKKAQQTSKNKLNLVLSPWSPPAFMKTNGQKNEGGKLKPEYRNMWARYISKYIQEYRKKGFDIVAVSVQNEPKAVQKWDSCIYTAAEEGEFVSEYLAPQLKADGLGDIDIIIWDHNKERVYERTRDTLSVGNCKDVVSGIGFHWYSGDHFEALEIVRKMYPDKQLIFTEGCVEYSRFNATNQLKNAQMYAHDIIGNLNAGTNAFIDWNMVLDEKGGPNHVGNFCDAPIMCDTQKDEYEKKLSYTYIGHFSKYILPGAVRVGHSKYTDKLEVTVFRNPNGSFSTVVLNRTNEAVAYTLRIKDMVCSAQAEPASITTLQF
ncbi:MAG: glucosylceramidase [Clostridia bacterium]|nr:glucosylceramidase [Clostridia bacterium]